ncbi:MAG: long-chain-fatty-acid--CoA ligase [Gammaproteobacteria bacterium]|nr:long-chain-fatty-acid--CoA ligase [Gammaproteobacteria bacterium]
MLSLTQFVRRAARVNRTGTATICDGRRRTWAEVADRVRRTAGMLRGLGVAPGDRVAILAPNSDTYFEYLFAVAWAGGVLVPVNTRLAPPEILHVLRSSGARVLVVAREFVDTVAALRGELPDVGHVVYIGHDAAPAGCLAHEQLIAAAEPVEDAGRGGEDLYAFFYTSGTTGWPKPAMITHAGLFLNVLQWIAAVGVTREDRFLIIPPMFHAAGAENSIAATALAATACIMPRFDVLEGLRLIAGERLTKLPLIATMLDMMLRHPQVGEFDLSSVTRITYGASPIHEDLLQRAMAALPGARFYQIFGQTEGGPTVTVLPHEWHATAGPRAGKLRSAGYPMIGVDVCILDAGGNELPAGVTGEICVRGPGVSPGYWGLPEETQAAFCRGWLRTGDAGYLDDDGFLFISDRVKDMIISGGENIYPAEVERVLLGHEAVAECAVIGIPNEKWGEQVHAIVRLRDGQSVTGDALIAHCRAHLAGYKCVRSVEFRQEPFPLSPSAKVLKRDLREPYWQGRDRSI